MPNTANPARTYLVAVALFLSLFHTPCRAGDESFVKSGHYRFSFETLHLPAGEEMGLLGGNYLLNINDHIHGGVAAYGALTGERGGFFTGGVEVGGRLVLSRGWQLDGGIFVGGGGGGSAPQGGGLMLRPHMDLTHQQSWGRWGAGISHVLFPNGDIDSVQMAVTFERDFQVLMFPPVSTITGMHSPMNAGSPLGLVEHDFSLQLKSYQPVSGSTATHGGLMEGAFRVIGVEFRQFVSDDRYLALATYGAMGGNVDGFAQVMGRGGYRFRLTPSHSISAGLSVGAAGGGTVDTGCGLLVSVEGAWQFMNSRGLSLGLEFGLVDAPDGGFRARTAGLSAAYHYDALVVGEGGAGVPDALSTRNWRWRLGHQSYIPEGDARRKSGQQDDRRVDLIGVAVDVFQSDSLYLTGQALGAYDGGAGGYAAGLVGFGWRQNLGSDDRYGMEFEFALGAGGGGGLEVGGGLLVQPGIAFDCRVSPRLSTQIGLGRLETPDGTLTANVVNLSVGYRFSSYFRPVSY